MIQSMEKNVIELGLISTKFIYDEQGTQLQGCLFGDAEEFLFARNAQDDVAAVTNNHGKILAEFKNKNISKRSRGVKITKNQHLKFERKIAMCTSTKISLSIIGVLLGSVFVFLIFVFHMEFPIYKNLHVEAKAYIEGETYCLEYQGNKYCRLQDVSSMYEDSGVLVEDCRWYWRYEHPYEYFEKETEDKKRYFRDSPVFPNFLATYRFCTFVDDPQINFLYEPNDSFVGPNRGWLYIKEGYVFPTIENAELETICIRSSGEILDLKDTVNKADIIDCVISHTDFTSHLPQEYQQNWSRLYFKYKDCPLYECVASNEIEEILWETGGTP